MRIIKTGKFKIIPNEYCQMNTAFDNIKMLPFLFLSTDLVA